MTSQSWPPILHIPVPRELPFREARRHLLEVFEIEYTHALMVCHDGDVAAGSKAANLSQRQLQTMLRRHEQSHLRDPLTMRGRPGKRLGRSQPQWLTRAIVALLAMLTYACQGELRIVEGALPSDTSTTLCLETADRRDDTCEPLHIAARDASDSKVKDKLAQGYSDCVEVFDIADQLCDGSAVSQPAPCLDALNGKLACFELARTADSVKERKERDKLLREFDECTAQAQEQIEACFADNFEPSEASCNALEGYTICGELFAAADETKALGIRDYLFTSYEICVAHSSRAYSGCTLGQCQAISEGSDACQLLLDAADRVDNRKAEDELERESLACAREFLQVERECTGDERANS